MVKIISRETMVHKFQTFDVTHEVEVFSKDLLLHNMITKLSLTNIRLILGGEHLLNGTVETTALDLTVTGAKLFVDYAKETISKQKYAESTVLDVVKDIDTIKEYLSLIESEINFIDTMFEKV